MGEITKHDRLWSYAALCQLRVWHTEHGTLGLNYFIFKDVTFKSHLAGVARKSVLEL